jgi:regulatory protein
MPTRGNARRLNADELWEFALRALDRRPYAAAELRRKLSPRAEGRAATDEVMAKLKAYGLVDDSKFAESFATSRLESQSFGARRVLRDLRARNIGAQTAQTAIERVYGEVEEETLAARFLERKFRSKNLAEFLKEEKNLAAAYRRLRTAGFSAAPAIRVLKRYAQRADELEGTDADPEPEE